MVSLSRSRSSSTYSTIPPYTSGENYKDPLKIIESYSISDNDPARRYQVSNPYAHSLWYDSRGESGYKAISEIKERNSKRKRDDYFIRPPGIGSQVNKKVDSPIKNENFFVEETENKREIVCDSPVSKSMSSNFPETNYRKAFRELITTELKYRNDLKLIDTVYRAILHNSKKYKHILNKNQEAIVFNNIEAVTELTDLLLRDIKKAAKREFSGHLDLDLKDHFDFVKVENINIGDILKTQFIRLKFVYISYCENFSSQISALKELKQRGGPKVATWLEECAFLAKSRSDCWDFQSLLIKPIQRLPKYVLIINSLLENSNDELKYEFVEDLYDAKTELEKLLDTIEQKQDVLTNMVSDTEGQDKTENSGLKSCSKNYTLDRANYITKVQEFKRRYTNLTILKKEVEISLNPLLTFILNQKKLAASWRLFMEYDDIELEDHFICSIYTSYLEKLADHEKKTKLIINEIEEKVSKAIDLCLEYCSAVRTKINKHNSNRGAYANYLKNSESSKNFYHKVSSADAQEYISIENEIRDELPALLDHLGHFTHYISLLYNYLIQKWLKQLIGESQLEQYTELLNNGDLTLGDNFDIIEMFSFAKNNTKQALKDLCLKSPELTSIFSINPYDGTDFKISASRVVRRLFGI